MKKQRIFPIAILLLSLFLLFGFSGEIFAEEITYPHGITEGTAAEAGLSTGNAQLEKKLYGGTYYGKCSLLVDAISVNGEYIHLPSEIPIYINDPLSVVIANYLKTNGNHSAVRESALDKRINEYYYKKINNTDFTIDIIGLFSSKYLRPTLHLKQFEDNPIIYTEAIKNIAKKKNIDLPKFYERDGYNSYLKNGFVTPEAKWQLTCNGKPLDKSMYDVKMGKDIKDGDVLRLTYKPFPNEQIESTANRGPLIKALAKINSSGIKRFYLEDTDFSEKYEHANNTLKKVNATQEEINQAVESLKDKPNLNLKPNRPEQFVNYETDTDLLQDFLLSNNEYTMKVGEEMELFCLDLVRACDQGSNYQRGDLTFEPIVGKDKIVIQKRSGKELTVLGKNQPNTQDGVSYFAQALKEGVVILRVYHPTFDGRPNYIIIHISNRSSDYGINRIPMSSTLDNYSKYDVFPFNDKNPAFPCEFQVPEGGEAIVYSSGKKIPLTSLGNGKYKGDIPLEQYWTPIIFTAKKDGKVTSKIYNLRSCFTEIEVKNLDHPGSPIRVGENAEVTVKGQLLPNPKIGKFYNHVHLLEYVVYREGWGFINLGGGSSGGIRSYQFIPQEPGFYDFTNGLILRKGFGYDGYMEVPRGQLPTKMIMRNKEVITNAGGQNYPQKSSVFYFAPNFSINVEENDQFTPNKLIPIVSDKKEYYPGEKVTLSIDIPNEYLDQLNREHKIYVTPRFEDGRDNSDNHHYTTQINKAYISLLSDIPGLQSIQTEPPVDNAIYDSFYINDFKMKDENGKWINRPDTDPIYHLKEKRERLENLKTLTFRLPKNTPPGEYKLIGSHLQIYWGPIWGSYSKFGLVRELGSETITVIDGNIKPTLPNLKTIQFEESGILEPALGLLYVTGDTLNARTAGKSHSLVLETEDTSSIKVIFDNKEIQTTKEGNEFTTESISIKDGVNTVQIILSDGDLSSTYTLEIRKGKDPDTPNVNKAALKEIIQKGESAKEYDYTKEAYKELQKAIAKGKEFLQGNPTQKEVDDQVKVIQKAFENTIKPKPPIPKPGESEKPPLIPKKTFPTGITPEEIKKELPSSIKISGNTVPITWMVDGIDGKTSGTYTALGLYKDPKTGLQKSIEVPLEVIGEKTEPSQNTNPSTSSEQKASPQRSLTILQGEGFTLPSTVEVIEKDNIVKDMPVTWDHGLDTNIPGRHTITGMISSTGEKVSITIEVLGQVGGNVISKPSLPPAKAPSVGTGIADGFVDIQNHWAKNAIEKALSKGLFKGVDEVHFAPNRPATRGEFITVLGRLAKISPENFSQSKTKDLHGQYYAPYANWALSQGILKGYPDGNFHGEEPLTREEMAVFLHKTLMYLGKSQQTGTPLTFQDGKNFSPWAKDSINFLTANGYLQGREKGNFAPKEPLTRGEIAQIIVNLSGT